MSSSKNLPEVVVISEKLIYIHNYYIDITGIGRCKGMVISDKTWRVQNWLLVQHGIIVLNLLALKWIIFYDS